MNKVARGWMEEKRTLLAPDKSSLAAQIIIEAYKDYDIIFLQDTPPKVKLMIEKSLTDFEVFGGVSGGRDSLVLVKKTAFLERSDETPSFLVDPSMGLTS